LRQVPDSPLAAQTARRPFPAWRAVLACLALLLAAGPAVAAPASASRTALSEADLKTYRLAFKLIRANDWARARRLAARAAEPLPGKAIRWLDITRQGGKASFDEIAAFIRANPHWPYQALLHRRAEEAMTRETPDTDILAWFAERAPRTANGMERLGEALRARGDAEAGNALLRRAWVEGRLSYRAERRFYARHRRVLDKTDHVARLDRLLWQGSRRAALRAARRVDSGWRALAEARLTLRAFRGGVDRAIARVPASLRDHPGLVYERLRWRRRKGRDADAVALLDPPPDDLVRPETWWRERAILVRRALEQGEISRAYRLTQDHRLTGGAAWADAEWLGGWIALRFLDDRAIARRHFARMYNGVRYPISRARAAYWTGRAAEALGDGAQARDWYARAAVHVTTYYGQLAAQKLPVAARPRLHPPPAADAGARAAFEAREVVRLIRQLASLGERDRLRPFFTALVGPTADAATQARAVALAEEIGRPDFAVAAGKRAIRHGVAYLPGAYPRPDIAPTDGLEPEFRLAVIRQESAFDAAAVSPAGARGLMQLMPATARRVARQEGVRYVRDRLTRDPAYNLRLGGAYLAGLLADQDGSYILALAAYNAGPTRARRWIRAFGDPRESDTDAIDWIESIPLSETRDYVQRVMENLQIYRLRANGETLLALTLESDLRRTDRAEKERPAK